MTFNYYIGIDPGVVTGFAIWDKNEKRFTCVQSDSLHDCLLRIQNCIDNDMSFFVRVEDARKRAWFGKSGREQLQGAGSIKRDCKIWEDYLKDVGVNYEMVAPKNNRTKLNDEAFRKMTGHKERTNEHARDAAMLVFGF
jgi:hypothetical protein